MFGNLITAIAGFVLAVGTQIAPGLFAATLVGVWLVMASGCVLNNVIDRDIDGKMARTRDRVLVQKEVGPRAATLFGIVLGVVGFITLAVFTNWFAFGAAALGFFFYIGMYTMRFKRKSVYGAVVGSVSGATPPVIGYCAAAGRLDMAAVMLFLIMVTWQMPHFYAIAIRRAGEYRDAGVPVMPVARGVHRTKRSMLTFVIEFIVAALLLAMFVPMGIAYIAVALVLGIAWFVLAVRGMRITDDAHNVRWARQMFFLSIGVMMGLFTTIIAISLAR